MNQFSITFYNNVGNDTSAILVDEGTTIGAFLALQGFLTTGKYTIRHNGELVSGEDFENIPGSDNTSSALAVNSDGSVIVGWGGGTGENPTRPFRWQNGIMEALPVIGPDAIEQGYALDVSADGSRIVGYVTGTNGTRPPRSRDDALLWIDGAPITLGNLPGGTKGAVARAISDDGRIVIGESDTTAIDGDHIFIWDELNGMRDLEEFLLDQGVDLNGWMDLSNAIDISADGSTILGYGHNAAGDYAPFIATIPEPGSMVLLSAGALLRRR